MAIGSMRYLVKEKNIEGAVRDGEGEMVMPLSDITRADSSS